MSNLTWDEDAMKEHQHGIKIESSFVGTDAKRCRECKEIKSIDDFPKNRNAKNGHTKQCKQRSRNYAEALRNKGYPHNLDPVLTKILSEKLI